MEEAARSVVESAGKAGEDAAKAFGAGLGNVASHSKTAADAMRGLNDAQSAAAVSSERLAIAQARYNALANDAKTTGLQLASAHASITSAQLSHERAAQRVNDAQERLNATHQTAIGYLAHHSASLGEWALAAGAAATAAVGLVGALAHIGETFEEINRGIELTNASTGAAMDGLKQHADALVGTVDTATNQIGNDMGVMATRMQTGPGAALDELTRNVGMLRDRFGQLNTAELTSGFNEFHVAAAQANEALSSLTQSSIGAGANVGTVVNQLAAGGTTLAAAGLNYQQAAYFISQATKDISDGGAQKAVSAIEMAGKAMADPKINTRGLGFTDFIKSAYDSIQYFESSADPAIRKLGDDLSEEVFGSRKWLEAKALVDDWNKSLHASGDALQAPAGYLDDLGHKTANLDNVFHELRNHIEAALAPPGQNAVDVVGDKVKDFMGWIDAHRDDLRNLFTSALSAAEEVLELLTTVGGWLARYPGLIEAVVAGFAAWETIEGVAALITSLGVIAGLFGDVDAAVATTAAATTAAAGEMGLAFGPVVAELGVGIPAAAETAGTAIVTSMTAADAAVVGLNATFDGLLAGLATVASAAAAVAAIFAGLEALNITFGSATGQEATPPFNPGPKAPGQPGAGPGTPFFDAQGRPLNAEGKPFGTPVSPGTTLGVPNSVAGGPGTPPSDLIMPDEHDPKGKKGPRLPVAPEVPYGAGFGEPPRPGESAKQYEQEQNLLEARHKIDEDVARLNQLEADNNATADDIQKAKNKLLHDQSDLYKTEERQTKGATEGLEQLGAKIDKDFGISKGLPGIAENLTKFLANLAMAPVMGALKGADAAIGGPTFGGHGGIGALALSGAFGPQFTPEALAAEGARPGGGPEGRTHTGGRYGYQSEPGHTGGAAGSGFTNGNQGGIGGFLGNYAAAGAAGQPGGDALGASGLNLSTIPIAAQKYANDCIDASARIILSHSGANMSEDQLKGVIAPGGSIDSQAAGMNSLDPAGKFSAMAGSGGSQAAMFAAIKASIDNGTGSILNVTPGSSIAGRNFSEGHFIAVTGYNPDGTINLSDSAGGTKYSVSAADAFQATRGRGIVAGTGSGPGPSGGAPGSGPSAGKPGPVAPSPTAPNPLGQILGAPSRFDSAPHFDQGGAIDFGVAGSSYQTKLPGAQENMFRSWVMSNGVPFDPNAASPDYDMRGYWQATGGAPWGGKSGVDHFPDTFKTPSHQTFSNESIYSRLDNPWGWGPNGDTYGRYADGGALPNTGGGIPIMAHEGEHVLTSSDVQAMGGQSEVYAMRQNLHSPGTTGPQAPQPPEAPQMPAQPATGLDAPRPGKPAPLGGPLPGPSMIGSISPSAGYGSGFQITGGGLVGVAESLPATAISMGMAAAAAALYGGAIEDLPGFLDGGDPSGASGGGGGGTGGSPGGAGGGGSPGSSSIGALIGIGMQEINEGISKGGQAAGALVGGLQQTFGLQQFAQSKQAQSGWVSKLVGGFTGAQPQLPNTAGPKGGTPGLTPEQAASQQGGADAAAGDTHYNGAVNNGVHIEQYNAASTDAKAGADLHAGYTAAVNAQTGGR